MPKAKQFDVFDESAKHLLKKYTSEERQSAMRAVCGARACKDAADARIVLEALGLLEEANA